MYTTPWKLGGFLVLCLGLSSLVQADIVSPTVKSGGALTAEVSQLIAKGSLRSEAQVAAKLGSASQAQALWGAIKMLELQGGMPKSEADWAELNRIAAKQDMSTAVARFQHFAKTKTPMTGANIAKFFAGKSDGAVVEAYADTPEEAFMQYSPRTTEGQKAKQLVLAQGGKDGALRMKRLGQKIQQARRTKDFCSLQAKAFCESTAPEAVLLWAGEGFDEAGEDADYLVDGALNGFRTEAENYATTAEITLQGFVGGLKMGKARSQPLQNCFLHGRPSLN